VAVIPRRNQARGTSPATSLHFPSLTF
jgi:hypothetical protein